MKIIRGQLVIYHPPQKEVPTAPQLSCSQVAAVVDINTRPAAVKIGKYKNAKGKIVGPRRKWLPRGWIEPYKPKATK